VGLHRLSQDAPAPIPIWLVTVAQPRAGERPLGTCAASGPDPMLKPVQRSSVLSCHFDFGVTTTITP
jgi:hypothetical protein